MFNITNLKYLSLPSYHIYYFSQFKLSNGRMFRSSTRSHLQRNSHVVNGKIKKVFICCGQYIWGVTSDKYLVKNVWEVIKGLMSVKLGLAVIWLGSDFKPSRFWNWPPLMNLWGWAKRIWISWRQKHFTFWTHYMENQPYFFFGKTSNKALTSCLN